MKSGWPLKKGATEDHLSKRDRLRKTRIACFLLYKDSRFSVGVRVCVLVCVHVLVQMNLKRKLRKGFKEILREQRGREKRERKMKYKKSRKRNYCREKWGQGRTEGKEDDEE